MFFGRVPVCAIRRNAEQVLCMARPWSRVETSSFGSSSLGDDSQSAPGMGRDLGLSAHARLFAEALLIALSPSSILEDQIMQVSTQNLRCLKEGTFDLKTTEVDVLLLD